MESAVQDTVTLAVAAQRLRMSYERAKRLVLLGKLEGTQEEGRWWKVQADSVEKLRRELAAGSR